MALSTSPLTLRVEVTRQPVVKSEHVVTPAFHVHHICFTFHFIFLSNCRSGKVSPIRFHTYRLRLLYICYSVVVK